MNIETERRINSMCNLSDVVEERGIEQGFSEGRREGRREGNG